MVDEPIVLKKSKIQGLGVFSTKKINAGERICFMEGEEMSGEEAVKKIKEETVNDGDLLQVDDNLFISMKELNRCVNHSCNPNSFIRGKNELVALKNVLKGEEITFDYSTTMYENKEEIKQELGRDAWTMKCCCGNKNCRKIIDQFYLLPKEIQEFYIQNRLVPNFILKKSLNL